MKKIIIASDSFKGCLSSLEVAHAAGNGIRKVLPACEVVAVPVADGGEGTTEALVAALNGRFVSCEVHDPLMNPIQAEYGILGDGLTAVIEMASASGLTLVPPEKRNPMLTTTYGTGELIKDALLRGCRRFLIGIGGSATNDAGTGMLQALGYRFLDKDGHELGQGGQVLEHITHFDFKEPPIPQFLNPELETPNPAPRTPYAEHRTSNPKARTLHPEPLIPKPEARPALWEAVFTIACDVNNPFSGENGAAFVYARQKGADDAMIHQLDRGLRQFATVIHASTGIDINAIPGAGAAGGLGGGFLAFLPATLQPGVQMVLQALDFDSRIRNADLIITGEGKLDRQTGMGKTPSGILEAGKRQHIPVVAIGGTVEDADALLQQGFLAVFSIQQGPVTLEQAMDKSFAFKQIEQTVEQIIRLRTG